MYMLQCHPVNLFKQVSTNSLKEDNFLKHGHTVHVVGRVILDEFHLFLKLLKMLLQMNTPLKIQGK